MIKYFLDSSLALFLKNENANEVMQIGRNK